MLTQYWRYFLKDLENWIRLRIIRWLLNVTPLVWQIMMFTQLFREIFYSSPHSCHHQQTLICFFTCTSVGVKPNDLVILSFFIFNFSYNGRSWVAGHCFHIVNKNVVSLIISFRISIPSNKVRSFEFSAFFRSWYFVYLRRVSPDLKLLPYLGELRR